MISYIAGRNFGHLTRCVANVSKFNKMSNKKIKIYTFPHSHAWLRSNMRQVQIRDFNHRKLKKISKTLLKSKLIIHDWRNEVQKLKKTRDKSGGNHNCIISGIYHSDLQITKHDTSYNDPQG